MSVYQSALRGAKRVLPVACAVFFAACATQSPPIAKQEPGYSNAEQRAAQNAVAEQAPAVLGLKRKIALGRVTNETIHGRSLLRDSEDDVLGKQVTDLLSKALTKSGKFLVFERPDLGRIQQEAALTGQRLSLVGVNNLLIGSLTEFGRRTTGESGFLSDSKKQTAKAKVDLRLVNVKTAQVIKGFSGSGEASIENVNVLGFGSRAGYDGTLNDRAVAIAIDDAINELIQIVERTPWQSDILSVEGDTVYISGGAAQGIKQGMTFDILVRGKTVKSKQSGFDIELPGKKVATVQVVSTFGDSEAEQGSVVALSSGGISGFAPEELIVQEVK